MAWAHDSWIEHSMYHHLDPMNDEKSTKIIWFFVDIQADYGRTVRRSNHKNMKEEPIWYVRFE